MDAEPARKASDHCLAANSGRYLNALRILDKLFGRTDTRAFALEPSTVVLRSRGIAETFRRPTQSNASNEAQPCENCGKPLSEAFITTGGPTGNESLWRDYPVAVDGWACRPCGVFRYPRKLDPDRVNALLAEGAAHGHAGRFVEADLCFARVVWAWPGFAPGHFNYAEATRERLKHSATLDLAIRGRLERRMVQEYELAIEGHRNYPRPEAVPPITHAYITLADIALREGARDRARRLASECMALDGVDLANAERARQLIMYVDRRMDLFDEAAAVLEPRIRLMDRALLPASTPTERKQVADALEKLKAHLRLATTTWRSAWLYCKGLLVLGKTAEVFAAWREAYDRFESQPEIARDYSLDLLEAGRNEEARNIARAIAAHHPQDALLWCNVAVAELVCGDVDAAESAAERSTSLDPDDSVTRVVKDRIARCRSEGWQPRTIQELHRGR